MRTVNLLDFLNKAEKINTLDYTVCDSELINFFDLMTETEQLTQKIDLGVIYLQEKIASQYTIVDGLNRILSLSLLLHAVCECYKKTSPRNDKAIVTIRKKYLLDGVKTKLRLPTEYQDIFEKIIYGERLSGKEKKSPLFVLLHKFWVQIKEEKLQAADIFRMLGKINVYVVDTANISNRDLYYNLNKENVKINQLLLIEGYLKSMGIVEDWGKLKQIYNNKDSDIIQFFKDFFVTKFNFKEFNYTRLYEYFTNYVETMLRYMSEDVLMAKLITSANFYYEILNVRIAEESIRKQIISIKMNQGEDTFAYLLSIYEDFRDGNLTKETFLEILATINEYLKNRVKTPNSVDFNDLIMYLNAFITCK